MDKVFSGRIDDRIQEQISNLAHQLNTSKKAVIEKAILLFSKKVEKENKVDIFDQTCGIWKRRESPGQTVKKIRQAFRKSMHRYEG
jgi:hypothetical protein